MADPIVAGRALDRFVDDALDLEDAIAASLKRLLAMGRSQAASHPTAQARMAASGLQLEKAAIVAPPSATVSGRGGTATLGGGFWQGALYGGDTSHGLSPRRARGYWLIPTAAQVTSGWLDPVADHVAAAIRQLDRRA